MPTRVKVCGITRLEDAQLAVELGAVALGFNFYPPSPRFIAPNAARSIIERLPLLVLPVGVYADETDSGRVAGIAHEAGVRAVQLHGPHFPSSDETLAGYPIIRAVAVDDAFSVEMLRNIGGQTFLLDAYHPDLRGGTGTPFDWTLARKAAEYGTIILAGGLTPENVGRAISQVHPFAVDVASGVESVPGQKDPARLRAFFEAVREADRHS